MQTALSKMKQMWDGGRYAKALALAAKWHDLGDHKADITRANAARNNPALYREMGKDPVALLNVGLAAMAVRYQLTPAPTQETL